MKPSGDPVADAAPIRGDDQLRTLSEAEEALRESEERYRSIFEATSDGLVINDPDTGVVVEANPAACAMHGYTHAEFVGLHPTTFIHPNSHGEFRCYVEVVRDGGVFRTRAIDVRKDGSLFHVEVLGTSLLYRGKEHLLGVIRDVTDQVEAYHLLEQRVEERTREIEALYRADEALHRSLQVEDILDALADVAVDILRADLVSVLVWDAKHECLVPGATRGFRPESVARMRHGPGQGVTALVAARGEPVAVEDARTDPRVNHHIVDPEGIRSLLHVPIVVGGEVFGVFGVNYRAPHPFSGAEERLLQSLAQRAALALENARLYAQADQRLRELQALYRADEQMHRSLRLDEVLQALADVAAGILGADITVVMRWDATGERLVPGASRGLTSAEVAAMTYAPGEGVIGQVAATGRPRVVEDALRDPEARPRFGVRAGMHVPIILGGHVFGVFAVAYRAPRTFRDDEQRLLLGLAQRAGLAIENARLHGEAERRLDEVEALYRADEALYRSLRQRDVLQALCDVAADLLRAERTVVWTWDERRQRVVVGAAHGASAEFLGASFAMGEAPIMEATLRSDFLVVEDVRTDPRLSPAIRELTEREGVRSYVAAPIRMGEQIFGTFNVGFGDRRDSNVGFSKARAFGEQERRLVQALAQRAGLAIQNARLHEESEQQRREIEALYQADEALHRSLRLDDVLEALVDAAMGVLGADGAGVWGPDPRQGDRIVPLASRGLSAAYLRETTVMNQEEAVRDFWWGQESAFLTVEDVLQDPRLPASQRAALAREGYRALLNTHVRIGGQVFGSFSVGFRAARTFSETEKRLHAALAQRAGVALQNARLYEQAQQAAALEERQRLARELHDSVSQALYGIALGARTARTLLDRDAPRAAEPLDYVLSLADAGLTEMRALIFELRPESLETEGLVAALTKHAAALRARHGLEVRTTLPAEPTASPEAKEALYRIAQEAMHNVVKHAKARRVDLLLETSSTDIRLEVRDDGVGFDPSGSFPGHLGLQSMRDRMIRLGGSLDIRSARGHGTLVRASLPSFG